MGYTRVAAGLHRSHTKHSGYTQVHQGYTRIRPCDTQVMAQLGYTPVTAGLFLATPRHCRVTPGVRQGHANGTPRLRPGYARVTPQSRPRSPKFCPGYAQVSRRVLAGCPVPHLWAWLTVKSMPIMSAQVRETGVVGNNCNRVPENSLQTRSVPSEICRPLFGSRCNW